MYLSSFVWDGDFHGKDIPEKNQQNPQVTKKVLWERKHFGRIVRQNDSVMVACGS